ncbi:MAG: Bax inhibitor-1/YccA family protein [Endozoicomonadaceae bacterium]|nr:Bax inhibitor-1/YccA family protein [Endozoicomonadaceae bacterium]MCY4328895.1 Bax inhibitor-1/YccA family protein [Endozoicomonadaceae bacterium]
MNKYSSQHRAAEQARAAATVSVPSSASNSLIKNTYMLLSMTLFFSGAVAWFAANAHARPLGFLPTIILMFGLLFLLNAVRNSVWALPVVFLFTGFFGYTLGPVIGYYLQTPGGTNVLVTALMGTGVTFGALSIYALTTRKNFNFLSGFLFAGIIVVLLAALANFFLKMPVLYLVISAVSVLLACGFILFDTSRIVNGGETNYVMATVSLYLDIYMLFVNLLSLLSAFNRN